MKKQEKKEKPVPKKCVCGAEAITVKTKHGKMITCPNPLRCKGNLRTTWKSNEDLAIAEWNALISDYNHKNNNARRQ